MSTALNAATDPMPHLVRHVANLAFDDLPPSAIACAKTFILDTLGVGIAGANGTGVANLRKLAQTWGREPEATVWGSGERLPAASAALVNGYQIHSLEYDCVHERAVLHPMAAILSAAIAFSERRVAHDGAPVDGRSFIAAIVAAVDLATFLGFAARGSLRFFRPSTAGGFGAAAAIAKLSGFDEHQVANALGIQYSQASGTMQAHVEGSPCLALQVGFAGRAGLVSADLAGAGFEGPKDILTGRHGYFRLFENDRFAIDGEIERIGRDYQVEELAHKPFPSGRLTHGTIDALMQFQSRHGFKAEDMASLECFVPPVVARQVGRPDIATPDPNYAKLCIPFVAATFLRHGRVDVGEFLGAEMLNDPITHALAGRVMVTEDDNPDLNAMNPQRFVLTLKNGDRHELILNHVLGHPKAPLTAAQNVDKFMRNWATNPALATADGERLAETIAQLETVKDITDITRLMVPADLR
ncbi:2-methylcitrate dehydratase PrpD [Neorhizobium galegae]|uniref:MmgE/PrpD family protein n=1 Tax=Neorhizobium galegae TaxID=399 RepID=UPI001AE1085F|nr:MmgE/PrpD family protein [Neorhizobium galegae]MBP2551434.1 2-methylcitrate dehydratase PrpD [Neorhizobium galegae]